MWKMYSNLFETQLLCKKMSTKLLETNTPIIPLCECHRFITDCFLAVGTPKPNAEAIADVLVQADYRGQYSHGMNRVEKYLSEIQNNVCKPSAVPEILKQTPATAWVEGHNGLGVVIANYCMDLAMQKARNVGVGFVVCKGSNHYGIAGKYVMQAMEKGLIGMVFSNTSPLVAPTRTRQAALGTNPLAFAAPGLNCDSFVLDMATSAVAVGKIEMKKRTKSEIPPQWQDAQTGALRPLGGNEENSSYKGYGLAVLVEILCGILGGGPYGPAIKKFGTFGRFANLGHCFIAINPKCFAPEFERRLSNLLDTLRQLPPIDKTKPVLVAGDPEKLHMKEVDEAGGVRYVQDQLDSCKKLAETLKIKPLLPSVKTE